MNCKKIETLPLRKLHTACLKSIAPRRFIFVLSILALSALVSFISTASAEIVDRVVATINDEIITLSELSESVEILMHQMGKGKTPAANSWEDQAVKRRVLEELIDKKLMEDYAKKKGISASQEEINRAIQDVAGRAHISVEQLKETLQKDGLSFNEYQSQIRDQIVKAKMIHHEISAKIDIKDDLIEGYYVDHPEEFRTKPGAILRHILLALPKNPSPEIIEKTKEEAYRILQEIHDGLPFEEAAKRYSQEATAARGGWLGFFKKGSLSPEMEAAVETIEEGKVGEPIQSPLGIHLIKIEEKTTGALRPLDKVRDLIREKFYDEAAERQFEEWRKKLRKNAYIEVLL